MKAARPPAALDARGAQLYDAPMTARRETGSPVSMDEHARETLRYIRSTMESAGSFTGVPGRETIATGVIGLAAMALAVRSPSPATRLGIWMAAACIAAPVAFVAMALKARRSGASLFSGPGRRFMLAWTPPIATAALLTFGLARAEAYALLPATWLLLYGAAIVTGGAFSIRPVVTMGVCFMLLGTASLLAPEAAGQWLLGAGFGLLHVVFGFDIWRHHGG